MSKIAVISDIHANKEALRLILKDIEKRNVDEIMCLGDLVTKYFYPAEVVDAIRESCSVVIKGNCDELVLNDERYTFARSNLGISRLEYLASLPFKYNFKINDININLYHSSPKSIENIFNPLFNGNEYTIYKDKIIYDMNEMFEDSSNQVSIVGHTHQNYIGIVEEKLKLLRDYILITKSDRVIVNVGSAGKHSHMVLCKNSPMTIIDPYLTYAIIKKLPENIRIDIVKIPYKETLKEVYVDMMIRQAERSIPYSPNDSKKIEKSLLLMR